MLMCVTHCSNLIYYYNSDMKSIPMMTRVDLKLLTLRESVARSRIKTTVMAGLKTLLISLQMKKKTNKYKKLKRYRRVIKSHKRVEPTFRSS